jgi:GT2 family glycosyltransferase
MPRPVELSVVIPAYRGEATIASCLTSVLRATATRNCQIIVVESSGDRAGEIVAREFPDVEFIRSAERLSVGAARNRGVRQARGRLLFFVDQDCIVPSNWINALERQLTDPAVGAAGGSVGIADPSNRSGAAVFFLEFFRHVRTRRPPHRTAPFLLGCNLACRADVLGGVQFPDQTLGEDVLFTHAVRAAGYEVVYDPALEVKHHNRTGWREFFRYNRAMGAAAAELHCRLDTPWARPFVRHPALAFAAPLIILPSVGWHLARSHWWYLPMFLLLLPMCVLGNLTWANAFRKTAARCRSDAPSRSGRPGRPSARQRSLSRIRH